MQKCEKHIFDPAAGTCRACRHDFCEQCLVYVHGPNKPPFCIPCALTAAGVRSTARRPVRVGAEPNRAPVLPEPEIAREREKAPAGAMSGKIAVGIVSAAAGVAVISASLVTHLH
jgi:hypothetical protein